MNNVYLLLGANEGNRETNLAKAIDLIEKNCGPVIKRSSLYQTEAWGIKDQNSFLNLALLMQTDLPPLTLLKSLKSVETEIGRKDTIKWGPRVIDIDILFYGEEVINLPDLTVPHPFIPERRFTLVPLNEIAAQFVHPVLKQPISMLLQQCTDKSVVEKMEG